MGLSELQEPVRGMRSLRLACTGAAGCQSEVAWTQPRLHPARAGNKFQLRLQLFLKEKAGQSNTTQKQIQTLTNPKAAIKLGVHLLTHTKDLVPHIGPWRPTSGCSLATAGGQSGCTRHTSGPASFLQKQQQRQQATPGGIRRQLLLPGLLDQAGRRHHQVSCCCYTKSAEVQHASAAHTQAALPTHLLC
jgi:hypothetical protein